MDFWNLSAILISVTALLAQLNARWLKQPAAVGVMLLSLIFSICLLCLHYFGLDLSNSAQKLLNQYHFEDTVLHGMLGYLLFAGAMQTDAHLLLTRRPTLFIVRPHS